MKKWVGIVVIIILGAAMITGAIFLYKNLSKNYDVPEIKAEIPNNSQNTEKEKNVIKDFTLYDGSGNVVKSSELLGKPTVIYFWASWCSACKAGMPKMQEAYEKYGDKVQFVMVALIGGGNDTKEAADKTIADGGYTFPVYYDNSSSAALAYSIRSIPALFFLDDNGEVSNKMIGSPSKTKLENALEALIP